MKKVWKAPVVSKAPAKAVTKGNTGNDPFEQFTGRS